MGQVLATNPQLAEQHLDRLFDLLSDPNLLSHQEELTSSFIQVLAANPQLAQQKYIEKVIKFHIEMNFEKVYPKNIKNMKNMLAINPSYVKEVTPSLQDKLKNSQTHTNAVLILPYAYMDEEKYFLLEKLTDPRNTLERPVAARALFLKALEQPNQDAGIREALQKLSKSQEPMERIWANKTIAMLDIATEAHKAEKLDGKQREEATNRLWNLRRPSFSGEEVTWAAEEAVNWLEEQGNEENARTVAN